MYIKNALPPEVHFLYETILLDCSSNSTQHCDNDDNADEWQYQTCDSKTFWLFEYTDEWENQTKQPKNPVNNGDPAKDNAKECEHESRGTNTIRLLFHSKLFLRVKLF